MKAERQDYLEWCKERANYFLNRGDNGQAVASFMQDMRNNDLTKDHIALDMLPFFLLRSTEEIREHINGYQ